MTCILHISSKRSILCLLLAISFSIPPCSSYGRSGMHETALQFTLEPPSRFLYLNSTGGELHCRASGSPTPTIQWLVGESNRPVVPGIGRSSTAHLRSVTVNGTLVFHPFHSSQYRPDVHSPHSYRCLASTSQGTAIVSRTVLVRAVVERDYDVQVYDESVTKGNNAILRCKVHESVRDYVKVVAWLRDSTYVIEKTKNIAQSSYGVQLSDRKHIILEDGSLHISAVEMRDGFRTYTCRTNNTLTGRTKDSSPGRLTVSEPQGKMAPRLLVEQSLDLSVSSGEPAVLPCVAQGNPPPQYKWTNKPIGNMMMDSGRVKEITGLLFFSSTSVRDDGRYLCFINNTAGQETIEVNLRVTETVVALITPRRLVVDMGKDAQFRCAVRGHPINNIHWLHNAKPLPRDTRYNFKSRDTLVISAINREDRGMYQCVVTSKPGHTVQTAALLLLGASSPMLAYKFEPRTMHPGPPLSLKCVAAGNPPPQFQWELDGFPLPENERFVVGQYVTVDDEVISHVNISHVQVEDGGQYTCEATNSVGSVYHRAAVRVYGVPVIRNMRPVTAVSGAPLVVNCPAAGYPIANIFWEKDGRRLPVSHRQKVHPNGTLVIESTKRGEDEGRYKCSASNRRGHVAAGDVTINVVTPPNITPFSFSNSLLREGNRASVICQIMTGDLPVTFRWEKDDGPIPQFEGITTRLLDDYTSQLYIETISSRHNGQYTCLASNRAATRKSSAKLTVQVAPHWVTEPYNQSVRQGGQTALHCQAEGFPKPKISWKKLPSEMNAGGTRIPMVEADLLNPQLGELIPTSSTFGLDLYDIGGMEDFSRFSNLHPKLGGLMVAENGTLLILSAAKQQEGNYLCRADNEVTAPLVKRVHLTVNAPAHFARQTAMEMARVGQTARLLCPASGDNPIDLVWSMDGRRIDPHSDPRLEIKEESTPLGATSILIISAVIRRDTASYTCHASNAFGRDQLTVALKVQEEPEAPRNMRLVESGSRSVTLTWSAPYDGNSAIKSYLLTYKLAKDGWSSAEKIGVPGEETRATVTGLQPANSFHIRVTAQNTLGQGAPSQELLVTTTEEEPSGAPRQIRVTPESSTSLRVSWEAPERTEWHGTLLGYYLGHKMHDLRDDEYSFSTLEIGAAHGGSTVISGLNKYTRYEVVVKAYNNRGSGPLSKAVVAATLEDAPSSPPETIRCEATSAESISVAWRPPPEGDQNGLIQGYRVTYSPATKSYKMIESSPQTEQTSAESTNLFSLLPFTNYSIQVLAYTSAGDGVKSPSVYCRTKEHVPGKVAGIKASVSSPSSILITWLPPEVKNGNLTKYSLHMAVMDPSGSQEAQPKSLGSSELQYLVDGVSARNTYQFWVTAHTSPGPGPPSKRITATPSTKVGAAIASFGREVAVAWKEEVRLQCHAVGEPPPTLHWMLGSNKVHTSDRVQVLPNGSLYMKRVRKTDAGNYTCKAHNMHAKDSISYALIVQVPPVPPMLYVEGRTRHSISLKWSLVPNHSPVHGYFINYKRDFGDWEEVQLDTPRTSHTLEKLACGSKYSLYVTAYNNVGNGLPSEILTASTKGGKPIAPGKTRLLDVNATSLLIHLSTWTDGGCPIIRFSLEYKLASAKDWISVSNDVSSSEKTRVINSLRANTLYSVKVLAYNEAGSTSSTHTITTLRHATVFAGSDPNLPSTGIDSQGGIMRGADGNSPPSSPPIHMMMKVALPIIITLIIITVASALLIIFYVRRKRSTGKSCTTGESSTCTQIDSDRSSRPHPTTPGKQYSALPPNTPSTQDTSLYKGDSSAEYLGDICPYATFQLPPSGHKAPSGGGGMDYGEATQSGLVYSGTYQPVQSAFVYHEPKAHQESYPMTHKKEPQYMKVRRRGNGGHPHESTESDNLGSTDSEVKKILSLHLPISEYDSLEESDDSAEVEARVSDPINVESPPTFAESAALTRAHIHRRPRHHPMQTEGMPSKSSENLENMGGITNHPLPPLPTSGGVAPRASSSELIRHRARTRHEVAKSPESSSSSSESERSSSEGRRPSHHLRRNKKPKRPSRSASRNGYDETSFSVASSQGGPPTRPLHRRSLGNTLIPADEGTAPPPPPHRGYWENGDGGSKGESRATPPVAGGSRRSGGRNRNNDNNDRGMNPQGGKRTKHHQINV